MPGRFEVEHAVKRSALPPPARHLLLTLATWADADSAEIPLRFTPSLSTLAEATGLDRSTIRRRLNLLEEHGWLVRRRPPGDTARTEHARTWYGLTIPDPQARGTQPPAPETARGTQPPALGAHDPQAGGTQPPKPNVTTPAKQNPPYPPLAGGVENPSRCTRHRRPRRGCADCAQPPLAPVPDHCGQCSPARRLEDEHGEDAGPCPTCHPATVRPA